MSQPALDEKGEAAALAAEARRQSALLQQLLSPAHPAAVLALPEGWAPLAADPGPAGLQAYRRNAAAHASRALATAYPVLAQLLGDEAFAAAAWALWTASPPQRGDLGEWGAALADGLAGQAALADWPYLPDVARLEWAVHQALRAPDAAAPQGLPLPGLALLAQTAPERLWLVFHPGLAVLQSAHPVVAIWRAHQAPSPGEPPSAAAPAWAAMRAALAAGQAEQALVWRQGWQAQVQALSPADARFTQALLAGSSLGEALAQQPPDDFTPWLVRALREGWLQAVRADAAGPNFQGDPA